MRLTLNSYSSCQDSVIYNPHTYTYTPPSPQLSLLDFTHLGKTVARSHLQCPYMCLKVMFEDLIAEPPSVQSVDKGWLWSRGPFHVFRLWCYYFIPLPLAVRVSLSAGLLTSHTFTSVLLPINMHWVQTVWGSIPNILISPLFSCAGNCCG
uniref:Caveolin n=1 Tax=Lates calcarifer TaxID=8187 RepID=A0A4W6G0C7_LATCA